MQEENSDGMWEDLFRIIRSSKPGCYAEVELGDGFKLQKEISIIVPEGKLLLAVVQHMVALAKKSHQHNNSDTVHDDTI